MPGYITDFVLNGIQNFYVNGNRFGYAPLINWNVPLININPNVKWITNNLNNIRFPAPNVDTLYLKELVDYYYKIVMMPKLPMGKLSFYDIVYLEDRLVFIIKVTKL